MREIRFAQGIARGSERSVGYWISYLLDSRQQVCSVTHAEPVKECVNGKEAKKEPVKLEWRDYVAITIAVLQTVLLPVVILFAVILVFAIVFGLFMFR
jgi:hypothetical protein